MKKVIMMVAMVVMMMAGCNTALAASNPVDDVCERDVYAALTVVTEVDEEEDVVYCVDFSGNEWSFTGIEDWMVGDFCSMVMDNMGTKRIYDDEIVSTRYTGWLNGSWGRDENGNAIIEITE